MLENIGKKKFKGVSTATALQMEATECGAAALSIVLAYYKRYIPLEQLRVDCGVSRDGSKATYILQAARLHGMEAEGFQVESLNDLHSIPFPYILFWEFNHFVVLERIHGDKYYINDPALGKRVLSKKEFDSSFTGVVLALYPGPTFKKKGKQASLTQYLWKRAKNAIPSIFYILLASLALVIPGILIPGFAKVFVDDILIQQSRDWFAPLVVGLLLTGVLRAGLTWLEQVHLLKLKFKLIITQTTQLLWHILQLPLVYFQQRYAGDISTRLSSTSKVAGIISEKLAATLVSVITMIIYALAILLQNWQLGAIAILCALINLLLLLSFKEKIAECSLQQQQASGKLSGVAMSGLQMMESIKAQAGEDQLFQRFSGLHAQAINKRRKIAIFNGTLSLFPDFVIALTNIAILTLGSVYIMAGEMTVGTLVAIQSLLMSFLSPVKSIISVGAQFQALQGDFIRLNDVHKHPIDDALLIKSKNKIKKGEVTLENITFGYSPALPAVLKDFSIKIQPGEQVAIVGATGSGKSTIIKLIARLYKRWSGQILLDGESIDAYSANNLSKGMAYVDQDVMLFEGSIRENLTLWGHSEDEQLLRALEAVELKETVMKRGGLDAQISEFGNNFSGGQKQRFELARALLNDPIVLLLDEATSALDSVTEQKIYQNCKTLGCTLIIIAHRLSAIRDSDRIVVLEKGTIIEEGTHYTLVAKDTLYKKLVSGEAICKNQMPLH